MYQKHDYHQHHYYNALAFNFGIDFTFWYYVELSFTMDIESKETDLKAPCVNVDEDTGTIESVQIEMRRVLRKIDTR